MGKTRQDQFHDLLLGIAGPDNVGIPQACAQLLEAIDDYKSAGSYIVTKDERGRVLSRTRPGIADTRKCLADLTTKLHAARSLASAMLPGAMNLFCNAYGQPCGKLVKELDEAIHAAGKALQAAKDRPSRGKNNDLRILAFQVARVMGVCLF